MADEDISPFAHTASAPSGRDGADDVIEFVDSCGDFEAREEYLSECGSAPEGKSGDGGEQESVPGAAMRNVGSHLDELRRRLVFAVAAFIPAFALGLWLCRTLWDALLLPLRDAAPHLMRFQALTPSDGLFLMMRIAFAFALFASMPIWISQIWGFIAPGLNSRERRWLHLAFGMGGVLFAGGVCVAYFGGIPLALGYLLPLNQTLTGWENSFTGSGYVDFIVTCCLGFGIAFELPLVMLALGWTGLITPGGLRAWWRHIAVAVFLLAAVMTPPDPFSQLMLALPMLGLFFLGCVLVKWVHGRREASRNGD